MQMTNDDLLFFTNGFAKGENAKFQIISRDGLSWVYCTSNKRKWDFGGHFFEDTDRTKCLQYAQHLNNVINALPAAELASFKQWGTYTRDMHNKAQALCDEFNSKVEAA